MSYHDRAFDLGYSNFTVYNHVIKTLGKRRVPNKPHMYVIGDSLASQNCQTLIRAVSGRYTVSDLYFKQGYVELFLNETNNLVGALKALVREGDIVVYSVYISTTFEIAKKTFGDNFWQTYYAQLRKTLGQKVPLIFLGYMPELNHFGMKNVLPDYRNVLHAVEFYEKKNKFNKEFEEVTSKDPNGYLFDFSHLAMENEKSMYVNGLIPGTDTVMYFDKYHFTIEGSYYLWPFVCEWLNAKNITKH